METLAKASFLYPADDFCYIIRNLYIGISVNLFEAAQTAQFWGTLLKGGLTTLFP